MVIVEDARVKLLGREPSIAAKVEIESEPLADWGTPPSTLRGRLVELGGLPIVADFHIRRGAHTISLASGQYTYSLHMLQPGANWFKAELVQSRSRRLFGRLLDLA